MQVLRIVAPALLATSLIGCGGGDDPDVPSDGKVNVEFYGEAG